MMYGNYPVQSRISPIGAYPRPMQPPVPPMPPVPQMPRPPLPPAPPAGFSSPRYPAGPFYPQTPGYPQYPGVYSPYRQQGNFLGDVWHGVTEQVQTIGQYVLHPFDASKRMLPYRNPYMPETTGEKVGHWIVDGGLIAGAFLLGKGLLGGSLLSGGAARVGTSGGFMYSLGRFISAPFRLIGSLFGGGAGVGFH